MNDYDALTIEAAICFARKNKRRIAREFTQTGTYVPEQHPVSVFMAGSAGAGKTEAAIELIDELTRGSDVRIMRIDPDDLRGHFEGYLGTNAWMFQKPASILVEKIHDMALDQSQSFVLDGTFTNREKAIQNISRSLRRKRPCVVLYVYQRPDLAWRFVQAREMREGRRIPAEVFVDQFFAAREVANAVKDRFGKAVLLNLLVKNIDGSSQLYVSDIDRIDGCLHDGYDHQGLLKQIKAGERS
ncbi:zeta toxin family protein [Pseudomonas sp. NPDC007930]|uniref:zeta toxin family protein n=1 Tax=Pseudomonas sp. NPDC007930 TaxID=3364417 RepID=UPI0036E8279A